MARRITTTCFILGALLFALVLLPKGNVFALTATPAPPTPTTTRTPTATTCNPMPPTYFVTVSPSASSVNVGDQIDVTVTTNVGIASFSLSVIDNATGLTQSQTDPIFTPAAPASQTPTSGTNTVHWTLTAVRSGSVTLRAGASGEVQVCSGGNLAWTWGAASGQSGTVTVGTVPTLTSTSTRGPGCGTRVVVTSTPSPTFTPTPRVATATSTSCGPIYITATPSSTPTPFVAGDLGYGAVSGKVTDATTGAAIAGAVVSCSHTSYNPVNPCAGTQTTAADGTYSFTNVFFHDTDQITVSAGANGYVSQTIKKTSFTTAGMTANFALATPNGTEPDLTVLSITEFNYTAPTATPNTMGCWPSGPYSRIGLRVTIQNIGTSNAGAFSVDLNGSVQSVSGLAAGQTLAVDYLGMTLTRTRTATVDSAGLIGESDETNNTLTVTLSAATSTSTGTPPPQICITRTPTPTVTITRTPTITLSPTRTPTRTVTPTLGAGSTCSPVNATITAPFTFDGAGSFCWQSSNLGTYINSWNTSSVKINGVNISNVYIAASSYPAKIGGFWYVTYNSSVAWGHLEAK